jgi:hypothetical protein
MYNFITIEMVLFRQVILHYPFHLTPKTDYMQLRIRGCQDLYSIPQLNRKMQSLSSRDNPTSGLHFFNSRYKLTYTK